MSPRCGYTEGYDFTEGFHPRLQECRRYAASDFVKWSFVFNIFQHMEKEILEHGLNFNRRKFLSKLGIGIGSAALGSLLIPDLFGSKEEAIMAGLPHFAPKAKRIIYLFQNGAPSQLDLFDYKPKLNEMHGQDLPESIRNGQRLTGMTANQTKFPLDNRTQKAGKFLFSLPKP